ncbi:MAG TPA: hypothetical protein VGC86_10760 [Afipia sp.]
MTTSANPYPRPPHPFGATYTEGLAAAVTMFFREFFDAAFNTYHPEKYYMRGPGPACRNKERAVTKS